ncbi:MAG: xanthine dehydrogenase/oxidase [Dokdonia sp.]|jgi:xanthine dehydrogenase/oxidase
MEKSQNTTHANQQYLDDVKSNIKSTENDYHSDLSFYLNGNNVTIENPDPDMLLVDYLRSTKIGLTGTKHACGQGGCGSCTVMLSYVDNASKKVTNISANSCLRPIVALDGMEVTTVEGLGSVNTELSPVQYQIAKDNGSQCGYCTPGFVMNMHSLLIAKKGKRLYKKEIEEWFDGNICRCTGYRPILDAMKSFAYDFDKKIDTKHTMECYVSPSEKIKHSKKVEGIDNKHLSKKPRALHYQSKKHQWYRPLSIPKLEELMAENKVGNQLKLVFGNTTTGIPHVQPVAPTVFIDISQLKELKLFKVGQSGLEVGASITYNQFKELLEKLIKNSPEHKKEGFKALHYMAERTAGNVVRNTASLAGNTMLVARNMKPDGNPFPSDLFTALSTLNTEVVVRSNGKNLVMPILDFVHRYSCEKAFSESAILVSYNIPYTNKNEYMDCYKVSLRDVNSHSLANMGIHLKLDAKNKVSKINMIVGGIDVVAFHLNKTEDFLIGKVWESSTMSSALRILHNELNGVIKALPKWYLDKPSEGISNDYRRALVEGYFYRFFLHVTDSIAPHSVPKEDKSGSYEKQSGLSKGRQLIQTCKMEAPLSVPYIKLSAFEQATGEAIYTHDIPVPMRGMFGSFVTSQRALASFSYKVPGEENKVDTKKLIQWLKAEFPTFFDYITHKDIPGVNGVINAAYPDYAPDPLFCVNSVTYFGQSIGLVVAEGENEANEIAAYIRENCIEYKNAKEEVILTIEDALRHYDPKTKKNPYFFPGYQKDDNHEVKSPAVQGNWALKNEPSEVFTGLKYKKRKLDGKECDIIAGAQQTGAQIHFYMETQSVIAFPGEHREIILHSSTQSPDSVQQQVSQMMDIKENNISVVVKRLGGGYGGKCTRTPYVAAAAAIACKKHNLAIRIAMPREVDTLMIGKRHPMVGSWNIAVQNEGEDRGKIQRTYTQFYANGGNTKDCSFDVLDCTILGSDNAYNVPVFYAKGEVCKTNLASSTAMRSYGGIQAGIIMEEAIEAAAHKLGMLPETLREKNLYQVGDTTPYGQVLDYCLMPEVWKRLKRTSEFEKRAKKIEEFNRDNRWKKRGISMIPLKYGLGYNLGFLMQGGAQINIYAEDGSVRVTHGGIEMGQGIMTKVAQIAAKSLNIPLELIEMTAMKTSVVPNAISTGATSGTILNGGAVKKACELQVSRLKNMCLSLLSRNGDKWCRDNGIDFWNYKEKGWSEKVSTKGNPKKRMIWYNIISQAYMNAVDLCSQASYNTTGMKDAQGSLSGDQQFYGFTYSAACTEVEIDVLTGVTTVLRSDLLYDIGKSINPAIDVGQIEGAFVMGLGYMTTEYCVTQDLPTKSAPVGALNTINTWTYKPPAATCIPQDFRVDLFPRNSADEVPENPNLLMSSKGVGEPPLVLANTVFFAIKHAILAARKDRGHDEWFELQNPATVERVRDACQLNLSDLTF